MSKELQPIKPPSEAGFLDERKPQLPSPKGPELILWVMITMLLVKFALVLFGGGK